MLEELKETYMNLTNLYKIDNLSVQELFDKCREENDPVMKDVYFAHLMIHYWSRIAAYYQKSAPLASPEDCYTWVVDSLSGTISYAPWTKEDSSLYNDPNAGDKVFNRILACTRYNFFQELQRDKRSVILHQFSLDKVSEEFDDFLTPPDSRINIESDTSIKFLCQHYFNRKNYFMFFLIVAIIDNEVIDLSTQEFSAVKFNRFLRSLEDEGFCKIIADRFDIDPKKVVKAAAYVYSMPCDIVDKKAQANIRILRKYLENVEQHSK